MKHLIKYITAVVSAMVICGCAIFTNDDGTINWNGVNATAQTMKSGVKMATGLVCAKNPDLSPIFKAVGEGLVVLSGNTDADFEPEQIKKYITDLLEEKGMSSANIVVLETLNIALTQYELFYTTYEDKIPDIAKVCVVLIGSMSEGLYEGAQVTTEASLKSVTSSNALETLRTWDMSIMVDMKKNN